ncbi:MAG: flippase-like domain-containing protein [Nitrospiraceae bacterium]|nr:flippase-like domain-containing protein [Nitrospiraceae bacterium]
MLIIKLAVSSGLLYYVLSNAGTDKVFSIMKTINPSAFLLTILLYVFSIYISTIRWRMLLPEEFRTKKLFSYYLIGSFFNTFLPGLIGGDAVKTYYLYKDINCGSTSLASVFMDRYVGFAAIMLIAIFSYIAGYSYIKGTLIEWLLPVIIISFIIVSLMIFGLRFGKKIKIISDFYNYFDEYKNSRSLILKTLLLSLLIQIISTFSLYVISLGLGQEIPLIYFFIFFPIIITISTLPVSISGLGIREWSFVLLFGLIGIGAETATAMSFAWFLALACGGLAGLIEYLRLKK